MQRRPALAFFVGPTRGARPMLPTPGERLHSGFARRLISVRGRAVLVLAVGQRPHPGRPRTCRGGPKDTANDKSISTNHVVVVRPFSACPAFWNSLELKVGQRCPPFA